MSLKVSTGLRNKLLDTGSLRSVLNLGFIKIYGGTAPDTADAAVGAAPLLCTISTNSTGTGLTFATTADGGAITKGGDIWSGVVSIAGGGTASATFYRHVAVGDTGAASTTEARIQGTVGGVTADLALSSPTLSNGATQSIDYYAITLPTL